MFDCRQSFPVFLMSKNGYLFYNVEVAREEKTIILFNFSVKFVHETIVDKISCGSDAPRQHTVFECPVLIQTDTLILLQLCRMNLLGRDDRLVLLILDSLFESNVESLSLRSVAY